MTPLSAARGQPDLLLHAYLDGELDVAASVDVERDIQSDPTIAKRADNILTLQKMLREKFPREPISSDLSSKIEALVGKRAAGRGRPTWMLMAASVVAAIALSSTSTWLALQVPLTNSAASELIDGHMRSLAASQQTDVLSSDRHTVKPWFNGKIPHSPKVVDLANEGFPLIGGRIDIVRKVPVPTLVYGRRGHVISLTAISKDEAAPAAIKPANGYNVVSWSNGETAYWAISDLNENELNTFAKLFQKAS